MKAIFKIVFCSILFVSGLNAQKKDLKGYLFAYFEGKGPAEKQEQLRFAVSDDAINWKALNNNEPIIPSKDISNTGGIRDPHILRGADGNSFYMVATDMNTKKNGWDYNPGIVLLYSKNLLDWKSSAIDLEKLYPKKFKDIKWVWAPQTFYDVKAKKYLVYFTVRFNYNLKLDFYCAYANKDFTGFEQEPKLMFSAKDGAIDGDVIYKDGTYHFFYKGNTKDENGKEIKNGIKQATSKKLQGPWKESFEYLDAYADTNTNVEGSSVFKLNNSDEYILMYDLYSSGRYEFQRSKDLYHFTEKTESFTKDFFPRHGSVLGITTEEAIRLQEKWGGVPQKLLTSEDGTFRFKSEENPIIKHKFTADPAAFVENDTLWLFTGHDFEGGQKSYKLKDWLVFSTTDLKNWIEYPVPLKIEDFKWDKTNDAYAGQAIKRNGKYYWYISTNGSGIGVAVADKPQGPYKDALGKPLLTNADCFASTHSWTCIDPTVFIDDNGQAWLFWGNGVCYYAKLKENMIEIDGAIKKIDFEEFKFTEAPWVHKKDGKYYLSYASGFPEKIAYAMADNIEGPYVYKGILNEISGNSNTNHQAILEFKGQPYFIYHNGAIQTNGSSYSRSVCIDILEYNPDGTIKPIVMTTEGVTK
ncbi:Glycosyl hydrolases family 43 [Flavobacterium flevense]|uniref:family 43 glycosylhydrolase n=1 Tax=Flavobacterium flevense TaxID=983 RepID=UPI00091FE64E|nr:family 43 glycosylhydrolase [Flavobacterium flevense]SHL35945.1 Glycosyl hydrolases family 43 [Flavobacterium flevense]